MKSNINLKVINKALNYFVIISLLLATVLYFCPIKYVQVWEHPGSYYSVYQQINIEYYWILFTSMILNVITIILSILSLVNKTPEKNNKLYSIIYYSLFGLCIIFIILSFVSGFILSHNYPKNY